MLTEDIEGVGFVYYDTMPVSEATIGSEFLDATQSWLWERMTMSICLTLLGVSHGAITF